MTGRVDVDSQDILKRVDVLDPTGKLWDRVTIFVGGADDEGGIFGNHPVLNSDSLNKNVYGTNYYATWIEYEKINSQIAKIPAGRRINVVGHSYGGDTAAEIVVSNPGRINTLITVDPVSRNRPDFA